MQVPRPHDAGFALGLLAALVHRGHRLTFSIHSSLTFRETVHPLSSTTIGYLHDTLRGRTRWEPCNPWIPEATRVPGAKPLEEHSARLIRLSGPWSTPTSTDRPTDSMPEYQKDGAS